MATKYADDILNFKDNGMIVIGCIILIYSIAYLIITFVVNKNKKKYLNIQDKNLKSNLKCKIEMCVVGSLIGISLLCIIVALCKKEIKMVNNDNEISQNDLAKNDYIENDEVISASENISDESENEVVVSDQDVSSDQVDISDNEVSDNDTSINESENIEVSDDGKENQIEKKIKDNEKNAGDKESTKDTKKETKKEAKKEAHVHSYSSSVTVQPTCITEGKKTFKCSCGDTYEEKISCSGHSFVEVETVIHHDSVGHTEVHETTSEQTVHICSDCGYATSGNIGKHLATTGHSGYFDQTETVSSGTEEIYVEDAPAYDEVVISRKCTICGYEE